MWEMTVLWGNKAAQISSGGWLKSSVCAYIFLFLPAKNEFDKLLQE